MRAEETGVARQGGLGGRPDENEEGQIPAERVRVLEAIADRDIDTCEIPEATEDEFARATMRGRRGEKAER